MRAGIMKYAAVLFIGVLLGTTTVSAQSEETSLVITLADPVHFSGPDDQDVLLPVGSYLLEEALEDSLRVVAIPEMEAILIQAAAISHGESIETPTALSTQEGKDEHHLVLLMPDGQGYEAVGSYSGLQTRGTASNRLSSQALRRSLSAKREAPGPGIPMDGRQAQNAPSSELSPSSRLPGGDLSQEKIRELERQRDHLQRNVSRKSIEDSRKEFLGQEKMNLVNENTKISKAVALLTPFFKIPSTPDPCPKPQVEAKAVAVPIEPLEEIILNGCGFGDQRGELRLESDVFPGGHVKLDIVTWTRKAIHARVPSLKGVKNHGTSRMRIVRKDLTLGEPFFMPFKATQSCELIPKNRVHMSCGEAGQCFGDKNKSTAESIKLHLSELYKKIGKDASFGAWHRKATLSNSGVDKASVNLGNGWTLQGMDYDWADGGSTKGTNASVGLPGGFKKSAKEFTIHMPWASWLGGEAVYGVKFLACGPWGVPF